MLRRGVDRKETRLRTSQVRESVASKFELLNSKVIRPVRSVVAWQRHCEYLEQRVAQLERLLIVARKVRSRADNNKATTNEGWYTTNAQAKKRGVLRRQRLVVSKMKLMLSKQALEVKKMNKKDKKTHQSNERAQALLRLREAAVDMERRVIQLVGCTINAEGDPKSMVGLDRAYRTASLGNRSAYEKWLSTVFPGMESTEASKEIALAFRRAKNAGNSVAHPYIDKRHLRTFTQGALLIPEDGETVRDILNRVLNIITQVCDYKL